MSKARDWGDVGAEGGPGAIRIAGDDPATDIPFDAQPNGKTDASPFVNEQANGEAAPLPTLRVFNPADWEGRQAPERLWIVKDYIPARAVTLLYADGGTGKSYLKLQLSVARALAKEWIGLIPAPGRTLVLSTEDDINEMWRGV